jgi:hypothetical protein
VHHQFTNACDRTVGADGRVAQIGVQFGSFTHYRDRGPFMGQLFGWKCTNVEAPVAYVCEGLHGQDLIEVNDVYDLNTGRHLLNDLSKFTPQSNFSVENRFLNMRRDRMSEQLFMSLFQKNALLAFDVRVENRFRDLLMSDRTLHKL